MISKEIVQILSRKKITQLTIDDYILKIENRIKENLNDVLTNVYVSRKVGEDLMKIANLKDAKLVMQMQSYKIYEKEGKQIPYDHYLEEWHKSL